MADNHLYTFIRDQRPCRHYSTLVEPTYANELIDNLVGTPHEIFHRMETLVRIPGGVLGFIEYEK